jgi:carbon starvation protein CstA
VSLFGETLFGGSRFIRRALSPFLVLFVVLMPLLIQRWPPKVIVVVIAMEAACIALLLGFWARSRTGRWAFRALTGIVFLAYAIYLASSLKSFDARRGFAVIGLPCLWYTMFGQFKPRWPPFESEIRDRAREPIDSA